MTDNKTLTGHVEAADFEQVKPLRKGTVYASYTLSYALGISAKPTLGNKLRSNSGLDFHCPQSSLLFPQELACFMPMYVQDD